MPQHLLQQSAEYAKALSAMGLDVRIDDTGPRVLRRFPLIGPVTYRPLVCSAQDYEGQGIFLVNAANAETDAHLRANGFIPLITPQTYALLDLSGPNTNRLGAMHGKWRNRLRAAQAAPITLHHSPFCPHRHGWLLNAETAQRGKNRYTGLPHRFVRAYPRGQTLLVQACLNATPIAAMLFLLHPPGATYHIGWSGPAGRAQNAHTLILWEAGQILRFRGIHQLNLGTLDTKTAPGLARFKLGSGGKPVSLGHTWAYLPGLSPLIRAIRHRGGFLSGLLSKGSIGGPRTSQETPHGSAQHRHYRPR